MQGPGRMGRGMYLTDEEKQNTPKVTKELLKRVFSYLQPYWKQLVLVLVCIAALCLVAFLLAKGNPVPGYTGPAVSAGMLKLTDTILILTAIAGVGAILSIIVGEIRLAIANKK